MAVDDLVTNGARSPAETQSTMQDNQDVVFREELFQIYTGLCFLIYIQHHDKSHALWDLKMTAICQAKVWNPLNFLKAMFLVDLG